MKEKQPGRVSFREAVLGAFVFFNATERGMTEQAFFDTFGPFRWTPEYIKTELEKLVSNGALLVEDHPEYGKIYRPAKRLDKTKRPSKRH